MKALNLGCGQRFHPDWTNFDKVARPGVLVHDLGQRMPFPAEEFELVYLSHVLEHFSKSEGLKLLGECNRVCRHGGVIRVVVPDLEQIASLYLSSLAGAISNDSDSMRNYDWLMLELYDQAVRERSGGAMLDYLSQNPLLNESFIIERNGGEARRLLSQIRSLDSVDTSSLPSSDSLMLQRNSPVEKLRQFLLRLLLGETDYRALQIGRFRQGGEIHHWMYDRFSLGLALEAAGFAYPSVVGARESRIQNWAEFHLDTEEDGTAYKPDSVYMEAIRQ